MESTKKLLTDLKPKKNISDHIVKNYAKNYESLSLNKILKDVTGNAKGVANKKGTKTIYIKTIKREYK